MIPLVHAGAAPGSAAFRRVAATCALLMLAACGGSDISEPTPPDVVLPAGAVVIAETVDTASFVIRNAGGAPLDWTATPAARWLAVQPAAGTIAAGASVRVTLQADKDPVAAGTTNTTVAIETNESTDPAAVHVEVHVAAAPTLSFHSGDTLRVYPQREGIVRVVGGGKGMLTFSATSEAEWLRFTASTEGGVIPGEVHDIRYTIDAWPQRDTTVHILIDSNDPASPLRVAIHVRGLPTPGYLLLPHAVTDAAFSVDHDVIVAVHDWAFTRIDPLAQSTQTLTLPLPALNVDAAGIYAAVGHDGAVTLVDVTTMRIIATVETGVEAADVAVVKGRTTNGVHIIPSDAPHARLVRVAVSDLAVDSIDAPARPPLSHFADGHFAFASTADGGIVAIDEWELADFLDWHPDAGYAEGDRRLWLLGANVITSATLRYEHVRNVGWLSFGGLTWEGAHDPPAIRSAHFGVTTGTPVYLVPGATAGVAPPYIIAWEFDDTSSLIDLPPVLLSGDTLPVEPFYAWGGMDRGAFVLQRARTSGGDGPWLLTVIAH